MVLVGLCWSLAWLLLSSGRVWGWFLGVGFFLAGAGIFLDVMGML